MLRSALQRLGHFGLAGVLCLGAVAAQAADDNAAASQQTLPPAQSTHDPRPEAPRPTGSRTESIVEQAGTGGPVAYARGGVLELGGGMTWSQTSQQTMFALTPTIGWFFTDNIELSAIAQLNYNRAGSQSATYVTGLIEPSVHFPVAETTFIFGGWGLGATYERNKGAGFAMAPRLGLNVLIGRSGILTPSATMNWSSNSNIRTPEGTLLAVSTTWGANIGYTVMW